MNTDVLKFLQNKWQIAPVIKHELAMPLPDAVSVNSDLKRLMDLMVETPAIRPHLNEGGGRGITFSYEWRSNNLDVWLEFISLWMGDAGDLYILLHGSSLPIHPAKVCPSYLSL